MQYGDNYAHAISVAMRIALGHGLTNGDVRIITQDAVNCYTGVTDCVEDTEPIGPEYVGPYHDGLEGIQDYFSEIIGQLELAGLNHDEMLTEFLLCLSIRPPIFPDH